MNTAGEIGGDQGPDIFVHYHALLLGILRNALAKPHRHILKLAFATLITDRAIERMVDQQEFHRRLLRCNRCRRSSLHDHAVDHIGGTGRHRFRCPFDLDQAHAAIRRNRQLLVIAKPRNRNIVIIRYIDQQSPGMGLNLLPVDRECNAVAH